MDICNILYNPPAYLNINLQIQILFLSRALWQAHVDTYTCLQTVHTNPHTAATLLFPACGYSQTESEWHHKPVCPFHAKPDVSLSHVPLQWIWTTHAVATARPLTHPSLPSVITYKSYWQLQAHLARSGSHSNQSVPCALNNLRLPPHRVSLHTFIIHHHDSFLCLWTAPSVISSSLDLPLKCIWQPSLGDSKNNKTDSYSWNGKGMAKDAIVRMCRIV